MAKAAQTHTFKYNIEDIFKVITDSILQQMKGKGKKNNIALANPKSGQESDYLIRKGTREYAVHFEITEITRPVSFQYEMVYQNVRTISTWHLESLDPTTTTVTYSESSGKKSFFYSILGFINRKKFDRTATNYFVMIDGVLEKQAQESKGKERPVKLDRLTKPELKEMSVLSLRELAKEESVDLTDLRKKEDIITALLAAKNE